MAIHVQVAKACSLRVEGRRTLRFMHADHPGGLAGTSPLTKPGMKFSMLPKYESHSIWRVLGHETMLRSTSTVSRAK